MSDFLNESFEWSGKFDKAVYSAIRTGKKDFLIKSPKSKEAREMTLKCITRIGHRVTNPKSRGAWKVIVDAKKHESKGFK